MANLRWRLETSINLTFLNAKEAGFLDQIEIIVSDWGSEKPLANVLSLISEAAGRIHFLHVSKEIAQKKQKDKYNYKNNEFISNFGFYLPSSTTLIERDISNKCRTINKIV